MRPFPTRRMYLTNENFGVGGWAEEALIISERILRKYFSVKHPLSSVPDDYYNEMVCYQLGVDDCQIGNDRIDAWKIVLASFVVGIALTLVVGGIVWKIRENKKDYEQI